MAEQPEFLNRKEASRYLTSKGCRVSPQALANWASNNNSGKGPPFYRFRWRGVSYRRMELDAWLEREIKRVA